MRVSRESAYVIGLYELEGRSFQHVTARVWSERQVRKAVKEAQMSWRFFDVRALCLLRGSLPLPVAWDTLADPNFGN